MWRYSMAIAVKILTAIAVTKGYEHSYACYRALQYEFNISVTLDICFYHFVNEVIQTSSVQGLDYVDSTHVSLCHTKINHWASNKRVLSYNSTCLPIVDALALANHDILHFFFIKSPSVLLTPTPGVKSRGINGRSNHCTDMFSFLSVEFSR